jgi:hypothetical protein
MKIELHEISVEELTKGFADNAEQGVTSSPMRSHSGCESLG